MEIKVCSQDAKHNKISHSETLIELLRKVPKYTAFKKMIENITISSYIFSNKQKFKLTEQTITSFNLEVYLLRNTNTLLNDGCDLTPSMDSNRKGHQ